MDVLVGCDQVTLLGKEQVAFKMMSVETAEHPVIKITARV